MAVYAVGYDRCSHSDRNPNEAPKLRPSWGQWPVTLPVTELERYHLALEHLHAHTTGILGVATQLLFVTGVVVGD